MSVQLSVAISADEFINFWSDNLNFGSQYLWMNPLFWVAILKVELLILVMGLLAISQNECSTFVVISANECSTLSFNICGEPMTLSRNIES